MRVTRWHRSMLGLMAMVALLALAMGSMKAMQKRRMLQSLGRDRITAALQSYQTRMRLYQGGEISVEQVYTWSRHLREAQREWDDTASGRRAAAEGHLSRMVTLQKAALSLPGGCLDPSAVQALDYYVKEAKYWVAAGQ
jgi:hypothetical protein